MPTSKNRVGMRLGEDARARAARHRRGDRDDDRCRSVASSVSPVPNTAVYVGFAGRLPCAACRSPDRVPAGSACHFSPCLARRKSLSLLRDDVHEPRALHVAHRGERVDQRIDVVTVDRPEVAEPQLLEQHARREERLDALLPLPHQRAHAPTAGRARCPRARRSPSARDCRAGFAGSTSDTWTSRRRSARSTSRCRSARPRCRGPCAPALLSPSYASPDVSAPSPRTATTLEVLVLEVAGGGHPERRGDRGRRMPRAERVVLALAALEEAREAVSPGAASQSGVAPGEQLVRIAPGARRPRRSGRAACRTRSAARS